MAKNIDRIADRLGAKVVGKVPEAGGGAFGAARLERTIEQARLAQEASTPGRKVTPGAAGNRVSAGK